MSLTRRAAPNGLAPPGRAGGPVGPLRSSATGRWPLSPPGTRRPSRAPAAPAPLAAPAPSPPRPSRRITARSAPVPMSVDSSVHERGQRQVPTRYVPAPPNDRGHGGPVTYPPRPLDPAKRDDQSELGHPVMIEEAVRIDPNESAHNAILAAEQLVLGSVLVVQDRVGPQGLRHNPGDGRQRQPGEDSAQVCDLCHFDACGNHIGHGVRYVLPGRQ